MQGAPKNVPNGAANTGKTVETVKKLRDPGATPLKRGVNEIEASSSSSPLEGNGKQADVHCAPARWRGSQYRELISARAVLSAGFSGGLII